jgi:hypothetical protein
MSLKRRSDTDRCAKTTCKVRTDPCKWIFSLGKSFISDLINEANYKVRAGPSDPKTVMWSYGSRQFDCFAIISSAYNDTSAQPQTSQWGQPAEIPQEVRVL